MKRENLFNIRFWFVVDVIITCVIVAFWILVFFLAARVLGWVRLLSPSNLYHVIGVGAILVAGIAAFSLRLWSRRFYGLIEIAFALVVAWQVIGKLAQLSIIESSIALGSSVYLIVRGLDNWLQGLEIRAKVK